MILRYFQRGSIFIVDFASEHFTSSEYEVNVEQEEKSRRHIKKIVGDGKRS